MGKKLLNKKIVCMDKQQRNDLLNWKRFLLSEWLCDFEYVDIDTLWLSWSLIYQWASPTNFTVGDLPAWTDIAWMTYEEIIETMLVWYLEPNFSSFSISWFPVSWTYEMWDFFSVTWNQNATRTTTNSINVAIWSISVIDNTANIILSSWLNNDWNEIVNMWSVVFNTAIPSTISQSYTIEWIDTLWWFFNSDLLYTYEFVYPMFEWLVADISDLPSNITRADVLLLPLNLVVEPQQDRTVVTSPIAQRYAFIYPQAYGNLTSIIDNNGLETISDYTVYDFNITSMLDGSTVPYRAYILNNPTTQTSFSNQYIF